MGKTKAQIAKEVKDEHLEVAKSTPDDELKDWSVRVYGDLKAADQSLFQVRNRASELDSARKDARTAHRRSVNPETTAAWRASVTAAEAAQTELRVARDLRNRLQALSELLSNLLRQRRTTTDDDTNDNGKRPGTRTPSPLDNCPFCEHRYTVRDGTLPQTDAEGNRLQLRKCQCREMAPPCKNCPTCKADSTVMGAEGEEQLRICQQDLRCEICACECPGAGKWIEGDEDSRVRFKERTAKRHAELSAILNTSWSGGDGNKASGGSTGLHEPPSLSLRRLPADIKNQLEAAAAAESLKFSAFDVGAPSASGATSLACGRMCCGEILATVKRRRLENSTSPAAAGGSAGAGGSAVADAPGSTRIKGGVSGQRHELHFSEGCGDHHCNINHSEDHNHHSHRHHIGHDKEEEMELGLQREIEEGSGGQKLGRDSSDASAPQEAKHAEHAHHHDKHHHCCDDSHHESLHHHIHRCQHPHDECTSDCCSAISQT